jgi:hypothetical protein
VSRRTENAGFVCLHCSMPVRPLTNGGYRNHCPFCLWSRHVDGARPGDRSSRCGAPMAPVGLTLHRHKGWQVVHRCVRCGTARANKVAVDTDQPDDIGALTRLQG